MNTWCLLGTLLPLGMLCLLGMACQEPPGTAPARGGQPDVWAQARAAMVMQLRAYGIQDEAVLAAMGRIARHRFVPESHRAGADPYGDHPCAIGHGQTISQPFIVAHMTARMAVAPGTKVLEVGTGSGYQAAVLAELGARVFSIEIVPELAEHARRVLAAEGYDAVQVRTGDGYAGWPEHAPFDVILVTCAPTDVPPALAAQLREGGRMIVPVGDREQRLVILRRLGGALREEPDLAVRFVPMVRGREGGERDEP